VKKGKRRKEGKSEDWGVRKRRIIRGEKSGGSLPVGTTQPGKMVGDGGETR